MLEDDENTRLIDRDMPLDGPVREFHSQGFLQFQHLLSLDTCTKLRELILRDLETTLESENDSRFSNIRERKHRWDLKLEACPLIHKAMREILENGQEDEFLSSILAPLCQCSDSIEDVVLAELGALISEPGAQHQQWHADSAHTGPEEPDCICCFVTLQDTPLSMGPTQLIPYTHEADFHESALANFPPKGLMPTTVEPKSMRSGYASTGEALLMDCRLYHRGSANTYKSRSSTDADAQKAKSDEGMRVVFYFTVRSRNAPRPGGFLFTILEHLNGMSLVEFL